MTPHHDMFQGRHIVKELDVLEGSGYPAGCNLVRLASLNRLSVELNLAGGCGKGARDKIEKGCLPGPVGTDNRFDDPFFNPEGDIVDRMQTAEALI